MFTLYKVILTKVDLMDGDTNLKTYNLKKNNGNDKGNKQLINLNCNFLKFKLTFFQSLGVSELMNPKLGDIDLYFGLY